jgi:hypothetical protein
MHPQAVKVRNAYQLLLVPRELRNYTHAEEGRLHQQLLNL